MATGDEKQLHLEEVLKRGDLSSVEKVDCALSLIRFYQSEEQRAWNRVYGFDLDELGECII